MPRVFRDAAAVEWSVYLTVPSASERRAQHLAEAYRAGWLVFESASEKRRLAPVPAGWDSLSDAALAALCVAATPQPARRRGGNAGAPSELALSVTPESADAPARPREPLRAELHGVTSRLDAALERVCEQRAHDDGAQQLDTGELIRVEETLAVAAEIAKEAVTLRRKLRSAAPSDTDRGAAPADGEHDRAG